MKKLMIRADDLGYSEGVNYGIYKTVKEGIIKNIGFMVNMDYSVHGYNLIKNEEVCLGLHTNICAGRPVSNPSLIPSIVQDNGEFKTSREYRNSKEDFVVLEEVIIEIEAQYEKFKKITGREPQYFECHAIDSKNFLKGLEIVAKKFNLKYCPISFDGTPVYVNEKKIYFWMDSMKEGYNPEHSFKNMVENSHDDAYDIMILHPGYLDNYILNNSSLTVPRTLEVEFACGSEIKKYLNENNIKLITYNEL